MLCTHDNPRTANQGALEYDSMIYTHGYPMPGVQGSGAQIEWDNGNNPRF